MKTLLFWTVFVIAYYKFFKSFLISLARRLPGHLKLRNYDLEQGAGVLELIFISGTHVCLCLLLCFLLDLDSTVIGFDKWSPSLLIYGVLIGIGESSVSSLLCLGIVKGLQKFFPLRVPKTAEGWGAIARGGWIRHHLRTYEILPIPIAILISGMQVGAEEVVFRGIIVQDFLSHGFLLVPAFTLAGLFFVFMQMFQMPSLIHSIFPIVGALVMAVVHSWLFSLVPSVYPLIIAHLVFFLMAVF